MTTPLEQLRADDPMSGTRYVPQEFDAMVTHAIATHSTSASRRRWHLGTPAIAALIATSLAGGAVAGAAIASTVRHDQPGTGIQISPPPQGISPAITASQALQTYLDHPHAGPSGTPSSVTLAELTAPSSPAGPLSDRLVWIVQYDGAKITLYGPPGTPSSATGTWYAYVDATSGAELFTGNESSQP
jgi:hypothetical protein